MDQQQVARVVAESRRIRVTDRNKAMQLLGEALEQVEDDPFLACFVAHDMGHTAEDLKDQLHWHLETLRYINLVGDDRVNGFYGSAHVNLGLTYLRLGDLTTASVHADAAERSEPNLADSPYGNQIRKGIKRLREEVERSEEGVPRSDLGVDFGQPT